MTDRAIEGCCFINDKNLLGAVMPTKEASEGFKNNVAANCERKFNKDSTVQVSDTTMLNKVMSLVT